MAVGTGNIWRFPRVVAQNGGGAFLIPWIVFLLIWSIPLLMVETAMGRHARKGTIGAFGKLMGPNYAWLGAFVGFCSMAIMFYYSVVAGWCFKYLVGRDRRRASLEQSGEQYWTTFQASGWESVLFHFVAMSVAGAIVYRGVIDGIEKASKVLIPLLFMLLLGGHPARGHPAGRHGGPELPVQPGPESVARLPDLARGPDAVGVVDGSWLWPASELRGVHEQARRHRHELDDDRLRQQLRVAAGGHHGHLLRVCARALGSRRPGSR